MSFDSRLVVVQHNLEGSFNDLCNATDNMESLLNLVTGFVEAELHKAFHNSIDSCVLLCVRTRESFMPGFKEIMVELALRLASSPLVMSRYALTYQVRSYSRQVMRFDHGTQSIT